MLLKANHQKGTTSREMHRKSSSDKVRDGYYGASMLGYITKVSRLLPHTQNQQA